MTSATSTALAGMRSAQSALNGSSQHIANAGTQSFRRQDAAAAAPGKAADVVAAALSQPQESTLTQDVVSQLQAKNAFLANLAVFKAADQMAGALLKVKA